MCYKWCLLCKHLYTFKADYESLLIFSCLVGGKIRFKNDSLSSLSPNKTCPYYLIAGPRYSDFHYLLMEIEARHLKVYIDNRKKNKYNFKQVRWKDYGYIRDV